MTAVAVVVPTRDRPDQLRRCVTAVRAAMRPGDELVVVDSGSATPVVGATVRCDVAGAARARNAGVAASTAPLVAFTDDDCRPEPGWLDALDRAFTADALLGIAAGRVVPDRDDRALVLSVTAHDAGATDDPAGVANGAALAVRRVAFEAVGGFDESLGPGTPLANGEDHDLWWRVGRAGWRRAYVPDAVVVHEQWRTRGQALAAYWRYGVGDGAFLRRAGAPRLLLVDRLWRRGLRQVGVDLRRGNELAAAADALKLAGVLVGLTRGRAHRPSGSAHPEGTGGAAAPARPPGRRRRG